MNNLDFFLVSLAASFFVCGFLISKDPWKSIERVGQLGLEAVVFAAELLGMIVILVFFDLPGKAVDLISRRATRADAGR